MKGITAASGSVSMRTLRKHQLSWKFLLGQQQVNINMFITEFRVMSYRKKPLQQALLAVKVLCTEFWRCRKTRLLKGSHTWTRMSFCRDVIQTLVEKLITATVNSFIIFTLRTSSSPNVHLFQKYYSTKIGKLTTERPFLFLSLIHPLIQGYHFSCYLEAIFLEMSSSLTFYNVRLISN